MGDTAGTPGRPVLRWAGGKRWLVPTVRELLGDTPINTYHEPFAGGAAVFFALRPGNTARLSDLNSDLVETYRAIRDEPDEVWHFLRAYRNSKEDYYAARKRRPQRMASRAARFIYLNHTSFNGIYRVNLAGEYNVPYGFRTSYNAPTLSELRHTSSLLSEVDLSAQDFDTALACVATGDLVFLDPPYTAAHNDNGFIKYNQKLFSFEDQRRLSRAIDRIRAVGAYYILTNAAHRSVVDLFAKGDQMQETSRKNTVGGKQAGRGKATEVLFTNLPTP